MVGVVAWASFTRCQPMVPIAAQSPWTFFFPLPFFQPQRPPDEQVRQVAANSFFSFFRLQGQGQTNHKLHSLVRLWLNSVAPCFPRIPPSFSQERPGASC